MGMLTQYHGILQFGEQLPFPDGIVAHYGDFVNDGVDRQVLADNEDLTQWDDISGNGFHIATRHLDPQWDAPRKALDMTNGNLYNLEHPIITGSTNRTIFIVSEADSASLGQFYFLGDVTGGTGTTMSLRSTSSPFGTVLTSYEAAEIKGVEVLLDDTIFLHTTTTSGSTVGDTEMRLNGSVMTINSFLNPTTTINTGVGIVGGGGFISGGTSNLVSSTFSFEAIYYDRLLSPEEILIVEGILNDKYSIY